jgi:hypothetical protein
MDNYDNVIDSREVIARIEELEAIRDDEDGEGLDEQDVAELAALLELARQGEDYAADWRYGEVLIRDSYFTEYARELAEDIGAIDSNAGWPARCIDWEQAANELRMDYSAVDFDGVTYWVRW